MRCILCYNNQVLFCNPKIQANKGLIIYNITNGITSLENHVNVNHFMIAKFFEEEVNSPLKGKMEKYFTIKQSNPSDNVIIFFYQRSFLERSYATTKKVLEDMGLLIVKNRLPMQFVEVRG
jgi:hypothetical protein